MWKPDPGQRNNFEHHKCSELPDVVLVDFMVGLNLKFVGIKGPNPL